MNYIEQLNEYNLKLITDPISPNARSIYISLLDLNNKLGWIEEFKIANSRLMETSGIYSKSTFIRARKELIYNGYILYQKGKSNILVGLYKIIKLKSENDDTVSALEPLRLEDTSVSECEPSTNQMRTECEPPTVPLNKLNKTKQNKIYYLYKKKNKGRSEKKIIHYTQTQNTGMRIHCTQKQNTGMRKHRTQIQNTGMY